MIQVPIYILCVCLLTFLNYFREDLRGNPEASTQINGSSGHNGRTNWRQGLRRKPEFGCTRLWEGTESRGEGARIWQRGLLAIQEQIIRITV